MTPPTLVALLRHVSLEGPSPSYMDLTILRHVTSSHERDESKAPCASLRDGSETNLCPRAQSWVREDLSHKPTTHRGQDWVSNKVAAFRPYKTVGMLCRSKRLSLVPKENKPDPGKMVPVIKVLALQA